MIMSSSPLLALALTALVQTVPSYAAATGPLLPQTGTGQQLPSPPPGVVLKHIALGFGIQNYTCDKAGQPAVATGALAMLYDVTTLYPGQGRASLSRAEFDNLTAKVLSTAHVPINVHHNHHHHHHHEPDTDVDACVVDSAAAYATRPDGHPFPPDAALSVDGIPQPLPFLGHHYFDADGVPVFRLDGGRTDMPAAKVAAVQPPAAAYPGPDGTGAVAWLLLRRKHGAVGVKYVYRVLTAGGASHGCARAPADDSSSYAATYWFYG
ncbi:hypothetical protein XA68_11060 [Ophiocordyceps unilateralis]|uniref:Malate dehydrogenase n=1 Tax=Ophiocordyceps unilateralis TaxID=268505 RepID=A0A2A9PHN7_OPHUN|nr:hypothetical protein XA68_11060 [Ophiocordyceps unilateralis]